MDSIIFLTIFILSVVVFVTLIIIGLKTKAKYRQKNIELLQTVTCLTRGTPSEQEFIIHLLRNNIPPITLYHDLYIEVDHDKYSQIDAVLLTKVGIIVFEIKDYGGWIFGKGWQKNWTQVLAYGKDKNRFYNPILQNATHIESLKMCLKGKADVPFFSVILFNERCIFRNISEIPVNVYLGYLHQAKSIIDYIVSNNPPAYYSDKWMTINILRKGVENGANSYVTYQHARNVSQNMT